MSVKVINKSTKPEGHVSPKRWIKFIGRNPALVKQVKNPEKYMHSSSTPEWYDDSNGA